MKTREIIFIKRGISLVTHFQLPPQIVQDMFLACKRRLTQENGVLTVGMHTSQGSIPVDKLFNVTEFELTEDNTLKCIAQMSDELFDELKDATFTLIIVPNENKTSIELKNIGWIK